MIGDFIHYALVLQAASVGAFDAVRVLILFKADPHDTTKSGKGLRQLLTDAKYSGADLLRMLPPDVQRDLDATRSVRIVFQEFV